MRSGSGGKNSVRPSAFGVKGPGVSSSSSDIPPPIGSSMGSNANLKASSSLVSVMVGISNQFKLKSRRNVCPPTVVGRSAPASARNAHGAHIASLRPCSILQRAWRMCAACAMGASIFSKYDTTASPFDARSAPSKPARLASSAASRRAASAASNAARPGTSPSTQLTTNTRANSPAAATVQ